MHVYRKVGLFLAIFIISTMAFAAPVSVYYNGPAGGQYGGYYTQPYSLSISGSHSPLLAMCDTFNRDVNPGDSWMANIYNLTGGTSVPNALFGGLSNAVTDYQQAAYVLKTYSAVPEANAVVWDIFFPGSIGLDSTGLNIQAAAVAHANIASLTDVFAVTPTGAVGQEFLYVTPEPGTLLMMGSSLLGLAGLARRRFVS